MIRLKLLVVLLLLSGCADVVTEEAAADNSEPWGYTAMCRREPEHPLCPQ